MAQNRKSKAKPNVEVVRIGSNNYVLFRPSDVYPGLRDKKALHIGNLDNNKVFHPTEAYFSLTKDYIEAIVFPSDWSLKNIPVSNISVSIKAVSSEEKASKPKQEEELAPELKTIESQINNSLHYQINFGGTWLLYQCALKTGIIEDLMKVFNGDKEKVNRIFTLASYTLMSRDHYDMVDQWQEDTFLLTRYYLDYENVIKILSSVTEENCEEFMRLRRERLPKDKVEYLCLQTREYRKAISKEDENGESSDSSSEEYLNIVFYALPSREGKVLNNFCFYPKTPFYLAKLPAEMLDNRQMASQLLKVTDKAIPGQLNGLSIMTDCGEQEIGDLDPILEKGLKVISQAYPKQSDIIRIIKEDFPEYPSSSKDSSLFQTSEDEFFYQETTLHQLSGECYKATGAEENEKGSKNIKEIELKTTVRLSLGFQQDWINLVSNELEEQTEKARQAIGKKIAVADREEFEKDFLHLKFEYDPQTGAIVDFQHNDEEIAQEILIAGFMAFRSFGFEADPEQISLHDSESCLQEYILRPFKKEFDTHALTGKEGQAFPGISMTTLIALILHTFLEDIMDENELFKFGVEVSDLLREVDKVYACERNGKIYLGGKNISRYKKCLQALGADLPKGVRLSSSTK